MDVLMVFAMRGGGVSRAINIFSKMLFVKSILNYSLTVKTCFAHSLGFILRKQ